MPIIGDNSSPLGYLKNINLAATGESYIYLETGTKNWCATHVIIGGASGDLSASPATFFVSTHSGGNDIIGAGVVTDVSSSSVAVRLDAGVNNVTPITAVDKLYFTVQIPGSAGQTLSCWVFGYYLP